jgi:DNA invertase Pin-like site-specific DNA recombinase
MRNAYILLLRAMEGIMSKRAAIYVRVSTGRQTVENQVRELRQIVRGVDFKRVSALVLLRVFWIGQVGEAD